MSIRATAAAQSLERTANLPSVSAYSMCAWGRMLVDRNAFQTFWTIENAQFEGMGCDTDGTTFQFFSNLNAVNIDTLVAGRWFWFGVTRNGTAVRVMYIPQPGAAVQTFTGTVVNIVATPTWMNALNDHSRGSFVNGDGMAYKVWDAVLADDELIQEAYTIRPQRTANLNLWTPMVHNTVANAALDFSGNGRSWTVVSTPSIDDNAPVSWGGRAIVVPFAGASTFNETRAETISLSDSQSAILVAAATASETLTLADSQTSTLVAAVARSETITLADSQTAGVAADSEVSETLALSDSQDATLVAVAATDETLVLADSQDAIATFNAAVDDTLVLADEQDADVVEAAANVAETLVLADSQDATLDAAVDVEESITLVDSQASDEEVEPPAPAPASGTDGGAPGLLPHQRGQWHWMNPRREALGEEPAPAPSPEPTAAPDPTAPAVGPVADGRGAAAPSLRALLGLAPQEPVPAAADVPAAPRPQASADAAVAEQIVALEARIQEIALLEAAEQQDEDDAIALLLLFDA